MTVQDCVNIMLEDAEMTQKELAEAIEVSEQGLSNTLNNQHGMNMKVRNLMRCASSMGYQLILRKDDKEFVIDDEHIGVKAGKHLTSDGDSYEDILDQAYSTLTKPGKPLPAEILALRSDREKQADELLRDYFVRHMELDMPAELRKIWPDDPHMYHHYIFRWEDTKARIAKGKIAFV